MASLLTTSSEMTYLNDPGEWNFFISHSQADSKDIALDVWTSFTYEQKKTCWLDVKMAERDEDAMKEGVRNSKIFLVIISPSYFTRPFCVKELEWAVEYGKPIQIIIDVQLKGEIGNIIERCPADKGYLKNIGKINFTEVFRGSLKMKAMQQDDVVDNNNNNDKKSAAYMKWEKEFDGKTEVNLNGKNLTDEDALAIGELLKTNNTLKWLNLYDNNITDVQSIGEGLKTNNTLKKLYLDHNNITDVQSIGEGLKTNNTLTHLYLNNNNITDDSGIQSIIDVLKTNNTLKDLRLHNNQLSDNMKSQLKAVKQYKRDGSNGYQQVEGMWLLA